MKFKEIKNNVVNIVSKSINPTCLYYFKDVNVITKTKEIKKGIDEIIFVRHIKFNWLFSILMGKYEFYLFIDDDLLDITACQNLPIKYTIKIMYLALINRLLLCTNKINLLVSNVYLYEKYSKYKPMIVKPKAYIKKDKENKLILFYHGTYSHKYDLIWISQIVKKILKNYDNIEFECFGNQQVYEIFKQYNNVIILPYTNVKSYNYILKNIKRDIGIAPILNTKFNNARNYIKFFDITLAGAAGIYSNCIAYNKIIKHGYNGLLINNEMKQWYDAISLLIENKNIRHRIIENARKEYKKI